MGGYGSGNHGQRRNARDVTAAHIPLDVGAFRRAGLRLDDIGGSRRPWLSVTCGAVAYIWRPVDPGAALEGGPVAPAAACLVQRLDVDDAPTLRLPIEWRRVGYGWRPFWRCRCCGELARIVYGPAPSVAAAMPAARLAWYCRRCAGLAYSSTRLTALQRAERRLLAAAAAIGAPFSGVSLFEIPTRPPRPAGMHWRTYMRRLDVLNMANRAHIAATWAEIARLDTGLWRTMRPIVERIERRKARAARAAQ